MTYPSVVIAVRDSADLTEQCLRAFARNTGDTAHELVLVNNASTDRTQNVLDAHARRWSGEKVKRVEVVRTKKDLGVSGAINAGLRACTGDPAILLRHTVMVSQGWLRYLTEHLERERAVSLVGPMASNVDGPQNVPGVHYTSDQGYELFARYWRRAHLNQVVPTETLGGFCLCLRRSVIEEAGYLHDVEAWDAEYVRRARRIGFRVVIAADVYVHHLGSAPAGDEPAG